MKIEIIVPTSGESVTEGDIARWLKKSGELVEMDEALLELETDKATLEIAAEADGVLEILAEEGATVKVGQVIGYLDTNSKTQVGKTKPEKPAKEKDDSQPIETKQAGQEVLHGDTSSPSQPEKISSPVARKLMLEHNIDLERINGSGKGGRITKQDVLQYLEAQKSQNVTGVTKQKFVEFYNSGAPVISPDETVTLFRHPPNSEGSKEFAVSTNTDSPMNQEGGGLNTTGAHSAEKGSNFDRPNLETEPKDQSLQSRSERKEKLSRLRKTISQRLVEANQTAALLTTFNEVDMSSIQSVRSKYKEAFKDVHKVGLGFMPFFTKAVCQALQQFPIVNAQMEENSILYFDYCDIGIAVATQKGLVVPVLRNAESMSFHEIEQGIRELATRARSADLSLDDLAGGTFTITNGGIYGSMLSTPIVNRPQSAILGMHNITDRPVVRDGEIVIRPMMYIALTYDHRLIDGADAVQFLVKVKTLCEDPVTLMLNL